jgi:ornithine carbamoyltransferase
MDAMHAAEFPANTVNNDAANSLRGEDLCEMAQLSSAQVRSILDLAMHVKAEPAAYRDALAHKQMVLFFEKASLRTRVTFEVAMNTLGGQAIFVDQSGSLLGERESLADIARNLERWVDVVVLRTFSHDTVAGIARHAHVPVINALSDREHPCQALADLLTLQERFGSLQGLRIAFIGDGNNVAHSLMLGAALTGANFVIASPEGYGPDESIVALARQFAEETGSTIECTNDPVQAATGADAVYTDVWASMGQEAEADERARIFSPFQVNADLMAKASPDAIFMHCLPAHRGLEVTDEVLDSAQSVVFDQAENRLHAQKAVLLHLLDSGMPRRRKPVRNNAATISHAIGKRS